MSAQIYIGESGVAYEPIEPIGPGGFGAVQRVRRDDGAEFALKTLHLGFDAGVLEAEAESLKVVVHENVIQYVDVGVDPEPFLVMELATDGSLLDHIGAARQAGELFPIERIVEWTSQLLSGLAAIHQRVLHRDLKPGNILVSGGVLKIGDFGMTRLVEASTRVETLKGWGTPVYMPPEGWAGLRGPAPTPAYDFYSLGVMLYEIATLQLPFNGTADELRYAHLYTEPPPPRDHRADLPAPLERLILSCLRKEPSERAASAEEGLALLEALEPTEDGGSTESTSGPEALRRLQDGAVALMRDAAVREAATARAADEGRALREAQNVAVEAFDAMMREALSTVERSVAPLAVSGRGDRGRWTIYIEHAPRYFAARLSPTSPDLFSGVNAPGNVICFGSVAILDEGPGAASARGGANIAAFTRDDAPWVVSFQEIQLSNMALMTERMRAFEPFYLESDELAQHGRWLWGGAVHVFQASHRELSVDVLIEWISQVVG